MGLRRNTRLRGERGRLRVSLRLRAPFCARPQQHNGQQREVEKNHLTSADLRRSVVIVIPAPDTCAPAEEGGPDNFAARLWNQPENEGIEKPTLRHERGEHQEQSVTVAVTKQCK